MEVPVLIYYKQAGQNKEVLTGLNPNENVGRLPSDGNYAIMSASVNAFHKGIFIHLDMLMKYFVYLSKSTQVVPAS